MLSSVVFPNVSVDSTNFVLGIPVWIFNHTQAHLSDDYYDSIARFLKLDPELQKVLRKKEEFKAVETPTLYQVYQMAKRKPKITSNVFEMFYCGFLTDRIEVSSDFYLPELSSLQNLLQSHGILRRYIQSISCRW